jgi:hypothetical protein
MLNQVQNDKRVVYFKMFREIIVSVKNKKPYSFTNFAFTIPLAVVIEIK